MDNGGKAMESLKKHGATDDTTDNCIGLDYIPSKLKSMSQDKVCIDYKRTSDGRRLPEELKSSPRQ